MKTPSVLVFHLYRTTHMRFQFKKLLYYLLVPGDPKLILYPKGKIAFLVKLHGSWVHSSAC